MSDSDFVSPRSPKGVRSRIECVHNKINPLVPQYETELFDYIKGLPNARKLFADAKEVGDVVESKAPNPYDYGFSVGDKL